MRTIYGKFRLLFAFILSVSFVQNLSAQVGFNNPDPDPSSVIDVAATDRGILIPRMTTAQRQAMAIGSVRLANSLMVYDTDQRMFFFFDTTSAPPNWVALNPWVSNNDTANVILRSSANVGIGTSTPSEKLEVNGNVKADTVKALAVNTPIISASNYALNANGNGPVPSGGIILWSGSPKQIPIGYVLCDGTNGTPNLSGSFVVSYDASNSDYDSVTTTGGANYKTIQAQNLPVSSPWSASDQGHTHTYTDYQESDADAGANLSGSSESHMINQKGYTETSNTGYANIQMSSNTGGGQQFDVRPQYYVLAYIMKKY